MATGLGEGEGEGSSSPGLPRSHSSLSPWSPLGAGALGALKGRFQRLSRPRALTFPQRTSEWYGLQQPAALFSVCQLPGYPGEGRTEAGAAARWAHGARRPLSPPVSPGLSLPGFSLTFPEQCFPFEGGG